MPFWFSQHGHREQHIDKQEGTSTSMEAHLCDPGGQAILHGGHLGALGGDGSAVHHLRVVLELLHTRSRPHSSVICCQQPLSSNPACQPDATLLCRILRDAMTLPCTMPTCRRLRAVSRAWGACAEGWVCWLPSRCHAWAQSVFCRMPVFCALMENSAMHFRGTCNTQHVRQYTQGTTAASAALQLAHDCHPCIESCVQKHCVFKIRKL